MRERCPERERERLQELKTRYFSEFGAAEIFLPIGD
jgi:hypothetical protein